MDLPQVIDHEQPLEKWRVVAICEERIARDNKPCAIVEIEDRVCFAYMDFNGNSSTVHCFPREDSHEI